MQLSFLGNGNSFAATHTGAYFTSGKDIIFIDMSMLNVANAMTVCPEDYENIYVFVTHMHDDHISGLGSFIFQMYFIFGKKPIIVAPKNIFDDVLTFSRITGVSTKLFKIEMAEEMRKDFFKGEAIIVKHDPMLKDKCYGYVFYVNGYKIVYSGDCARLDELRYALRSADEFYCETTTNPKVDVHMYFDNIKEELLTLHDKGIEIYLMHFDSYFAIMNKTYDLPIHIAEINF